MNKKILAAVAVVALFALAVMWPVKAAETRGAYNTFLMSTGTYTFSGDGSGAVSATNASIGFGAGTGINGTTVVEVGRDSGMAFMVNFAGSAIGAAGTNATVTFRFAVANTLTTNAANFTNVRTNLAFAFPANGSTQVKGYALFPPTVLNNVKAIKLMQVEITGGTNDIYLTNVVASKYFPP